jgi:serine acetyltransferase
VILPGNVIGRDCIVGTGSVVRGRVPDGSVVIGNPARFVMTTAMARRLAVRHRNSLTVAGLSPEERRRTALEPFGLRRGG